MRQVTSADSGAHSASTETFSALHTLLLSVEAVDDFLQEVADLASRIVSPPVSCGISVEYDGHPLTVASSDVKARALDESQYDADEGTCLHAMRTGELVQMRDIDKESRWPTYMAKAREQGLRSSLSLPLIVQNTSVGAINLYSFAQCHVFDDEAQAHVERFAAQASTALMLALRQAKNKATNQQLEAALASRTVIDQALGIIMGQQRCTPEQAFDILRRHSQHNNVKLREVAADLVARTTGARGEAPAKDEPGPRAPA